MGETITKPDANPILLAILNVFICGFPIGYFLMGQQKKAMFGCVYVFLLQFVGVGMVLACVFAYDAYLLGQKLAAGESIADNQNGLDFLNNLPGFK